MGSLVLGTVGAVIGASFGAPQVGYALGSAIGGALFPEAVKDGPRITDLKVQNSQFGSPIPIVYGSYRLAGQLIWAAKLVEHPDQTDSGSGGGGSTNYTYTCSFAISICQRYPKKGSALGRIWADGKLIYDGRVNPTKVGFIASKPVKFYDGVETQLPDSTMEAELGVGNVPAYRGQVYVVFTDLELGKFGNRLPNFTFEINPVGVVIMCPPVPTSYAFSLPYTAPAYTSTLSYDEWSCYVEMQDEFWIPGSGAAFLRVRASDWTAGATIPADTSTSQAGIQYCQYDPHFNKVWAASFGVGLNPQYNGMVRYDAVTGARDFLAEPSVSFVSDPTNMAVNRADGTCWSVGGNSAAGYKLFHLSGTGTTLVALPLGTRSATIVDVDRTGTAWLVSGETTSSFGNYLSTVSETGTETIVYTAPASFSLKNMSVDTINNAVWVWEVDYSVAAFSHSAQVRKWDIATSAFVLSLSVPFTVPTTFVFDNVRNLLWLRTGQNLPNLGVLEGRCGINGEVIHSGVSTAIAAGDRRGVMYRKPGNNIFFDSYGANYAIGEYSWVEPPPVALGTDPVTLGEIVADLSNKAGLLPAQIDVSQLTTLVNGYAVSSRMPARSATQPLSDAFFFDSVESQGTIKFVPRGGASALSISAHTVVGKT